MVGDSDLEVDSLVSALAKNRPIILVDDFVGSGGQSKLIVRSWFGAHHRGILNEAPRLELNKTQQSQIRRAKLGFVFAAGWTDGANELSAACQSLTLNAKIHVEIKDEQLPALTSPKFGFTPDFITHCRKIGKQVLRASNPRWRINKIEERALGYGNRGLLVTFPFNTPTQTLSCIWADGKFEGFTWMPLLPRRTKK